MITIPELTVSNISCVRGEAGADFDELVLSALDGVRGEHFGGVVAATFSYPRRFPSLAVKVAGALGLGNDVPAFDLQMACSAYPYAVYTAGRLAIDIGAPVLVVDGDVQTHLVDSADHATGGIFSDAVSVSVVMPSGSGESRFAFLSAYDREALVCPSEGPIHMDGFKVFSFVATEVTEFLRQFGDDFDIFAPHQANPYMIRQLAKSLSLSGKLVTIPDDFRNPGSCSVAAALAQSGRKGRALIAGFGAGYSACAGIVRIS